MRRTVAVVALVLCAGALGVVVVRAAQHERPPITNRNLAESVNDETGGDSAGELASCKQRARGWFCVISDPGGSTYAGYTVTATSRSCWRARLTEAGERAPETAEGCVS